MRPTFVCDSWTTEEKTHTEKETETGNNKKKNEKKRKTHIFFMIVFFLLSNFMFSSHEILRCDTTIRLSSPQFTLSLPWSWAFYDLTVVTIRKWKFLLHDVAQCDPFFVVERSIIETIFGWHLLLSADHFYINRPHKISLKNFDRCEDANIHHCIREK